ncbi:MULTISPECIES: ABC transporter ATP-binding protein [unclassified Lysinibacillus]|jgi:ABC-type cobalamin/Fe3+-siderophores transport system ATPase subunit|uniref:ABC transporter ATP-binding protein n=1 Tax=unclassified Lysinibacillus TaxID=2636778 RepID=UPI0007389431|nr:MULTISPECIES: ABC transporter ATP-binding protein [unclassified Lysinibacillus]KUF36749.1 iron-dicitrate transporter ATP-binding subunit [Lysinibacillus sp. F5]SCX95358.1 iron complex transport system ATP-binding protein [Lysinibacillus sp. SG9]SDB07460.1 iron complex transport system ATP-binding protein [Lysinibacillus sp. TC-37]SFS39770.1 iron complex transport system ATP-binding protein [Lysinibacillus sp. SG55]
MTTLSAEHLSLSYGSTQILDDINLVIPEGKISVIIGSNGCGKSTILRSLARLLTPQEGIVYLDGKAIHQQSSKEIAKKLAILPQGPEAPEDITVKDLCYYGRHPHKGLLSRQTLEDDAIVNRALMATKMTDFVDRTLDELSGGQRQRAWISMALAQDTDLLLLDEPTTYLDLAHQIEILELLRNLNVTHGRTIVMVLHDLNQAAQYADHLISIVKGKIFQEGPPEKVFTKSMIREAFGLDCYIIENPVDQTPLCIPIGLSLS